MKGVITFPGRNGYGRRLIDWDPNNVSPRVGFNWRPFGSTTTVVRGGFGIFFGNPFDRNVFQIAGLGFDATGTYRDPVPFTLQQGLPAGSLVAPSEADLNRSSERGARSSRFRRYSSSILAAERSTTKTSTSPSSGNGAACFSRSVIWETWAAR